MPDDSLTQLRELDAAVRAASAVLTQAEIAFEDEALRIPSRDLIGLAASDPIVSRVLDAAELDKDVAIGTDNSKIFHSLDPWNAQQTTCKRRVSNMRVVSHRGRRWCAACSNSSAW